MFFQRVAVFAWLCALAFSTSLMADPPFAHGHAIVHGHDGHFGHGFHHGGYHHGWHHHFGWHHHGHGYFPWLLPATGLSWSIGYGYCPTTSWYGFGSPYPVIGTYGYGGVTASTITTPGLVIGSGVNGSLLGPAGRALQDHAMRSELKKNERRWNQPIDQLPVIPAAHQFVKPSTPAQQLRSFREQQRGDQDLRKLDYTQAARHYRAAISAAEDRSAPYQRLGLVEAARGNYHEAAKKWIVAVTLDPNWPRTGPTFDSLFDQRYETEIIRIQERVSEWVGQDVRDPMRLFVMGVITHFRGDERAAVFLEAAARLGGKKSYLAAFLDTQPAAKVNGPRVIEGMRQPRETQPETMSAKPLPLAPVPLLVKPASPAAPETPNKPSTPVEVTPSSEPGPLLPPAPSPVR